MTEFSRHIWALVRPYKTRTALGILCGILSGLSSPMLVLTIALVISVIFPGTNQSALVDRLKSLPDFVRGPVEGLLSHASGGELSTNRLLEILVISLIPLVMFLRSVVSYLNVYLLEWVSVRAITDLRARLFNHMVNQSLGFFGGARTGDLMSRITSDTSAMQRII